LESEVLRCGNAGFARLRIERHAMSSRPVHVLLIEDDEIEAEAVLRAFRRLQMEERITIASDGLEGLNILRGHHEQGPLPYPYIVLLDLNMPRMSGFEFLDVVRYDPALKRSVVFVLTTSNREEDKLAAYDRQVAGYLVKSQLGDDFARLTEMLTVYEQIIEFPPEGV
jgi:CheY-like chemotaxis protein